MRIKTKQRFGVNLGLVSLNRSQNSLREITGDHARWASTVQDCYKTNAIFYHQMVVWSAAHASEITFDIGINSYGFIFQTIYFSDWQLHPMMHWEEILIMNSNSLIIFWQRLCHNTIDMTLYKQHWYQFASKFWTAYHVFYFIYLFSY